MRSRDVEQAPPLFNVAGYAFLGRTRDGKNDPVAAACIYSDASRSGNDADDANTDFSTVTKR